MLQKKKKQPITLLEIMIVIFLIGLIGGVVGYNMKGSLDEGRAFKTEHAASRLREILLLEIANGADIDSVIESPGHYLVNSGLCEKSEKLLKDGWSQPFEIKRKGKDDISIRSEKLINYKKKKNDKLGIKDPVEDDEFQEEI